MRQMMLRHDWARCTDGELLAACAAEPEAFREVYRRHERSVATFLIRRTRNAEQAADLTAETFAAALLKADRFRDECGQPAIGWLLGIARHTWLRSLERHRTERAALRRLRIETIDVSDASLERIEALIDDQAPDNPVLAHLAELPHDQRDAVRAYILDERPYNELAAELRVSEATVRQRVSRGLARLRAALGQDTP
jgi:RNA polymerase sigma factor (sigma-70 family)